VNAAVNWLKRQAETWIKAGLNVRQGCAGLGSFLAHVHFSKSPKKTVAKRSPEQPAPL